MNEHHGQQEALFEQALECPSREARAAFLDRACRGNPELRARLDLMLEGHFRAQGFLDEAGECCQAKADDQVGATIGRYKLLEKIGEGGFGAVYMAEQCEPVKRRVALKIIKAGMDSKEVIARFEAERQALALMDHPNIAKVLDGGEIRSSPAQPSTLHSQLPVGRPYFVMELVRGIPITDFCDRTNLPTRERLELLIQVCQAVQHAHQKGIIHRDLKPSNILITTVDGVPVPKVIDFGIAKAMDQRLTEKTMFTAFSQFLGTPAYISPEQAEITALDVDTRSDIYSLGVLLYELLTGRTPFDGEALVQAGLDAMRRIIREEEPPKPSTRLSTLGHEALTQVARHRHAEPPRLVHMVRGELDWIVMKCLEKDRRRRYESANDLAMDLQRQLNQEPVLAAAPSAVYRLGKLVRRHRLTFAATSAVAASLIVGLGTSTWQYVQKNRAYRRATMAEQEQIGLRKQAEQAAREAVTERRRAEASEAETRHALYVARIRSLRDAWNNNDMPRMRELLEQTRTYSDRGFEWRFWQQRSERRRLQGDGDIIESVIFLPTGQRVLGCGLLNRAYMWDWPSGRLLFQLGKDTAAAGALPLPFAPSPDGSRVMIGDRLATRVCDAFTGQTLLKLAAHGGAVTSVAFSPNGKWIATGGGDDTARIWDASTGRQLFTLGIPTHRILKTPAPPVGIRMMGPHDDSIDVVRSVSSGDLYTASDPSAYYMRVAFSPDSQILASASSDGSTILWNATTGGRLSTLETNADGSPVELVFLQNGHHLLSARLGQPACVWDWPGGSLAFRLESATQPVTKVAVSHEGRFVVTAVDQVATLWDASAGVVLRRFDKQPERILAVAVSPDGQRVAIADRTVELLDATTGREMARFRGKPGLVRAVTFSPDGKWLLAGDEHIVRVWRCPENPQAVAWNVEGPARAAAFSPVDDRVAIAEEQTIGVWDTATGRHLYSFAGPPQPVTAIAYSPDGRQIVSGSRDGSVRLWDADSGAEMGTSISHLNVESVEFSPDGRAILTTSETARVWDVRTRQLLSELARHDEETTRRPERVTLSPEDAVAPVKGGRVLARQDSPTTAWSRTAVGYKSAAKIWALLAGTQIVALPKAGNSAAHSPDGRCVLIGGEGGSSSAVLRKADTGHELARFEGHTDEVLSVAFSPDGRRVLTGSRDGTARLWDPKSGDQLLTLEWGQPSVDFTAFSFDGSKVALGCTNGTFAVFDSSLPED